MILQNGAVGQLVYNEATFPCEMPTEGIFSWGGSWDINYKMTLGGGWEAPAAELPGLRDEGRVEGLPLCQQAVPLRGGEREQIRVLDRAHAGQFCHADGVFRPGDSGEKEPGGDGF